MAADAQDRLHVFLLPLPALGHVNPLLHFAHRLLSSSKCTVTLVYSSHIYHLLKRQHRTDALGENLPHFRVEVVPDGLPTHDKYSLSLEELRRAMAVVEEGMEGVIERSLASSHHPVSCIVSDVFLSCAQHIANKYALPKADLWCASAGSYSIGLHMPLLSSLGFIPYKGQNDMIEFIPGLLPMRVTDLPKPVLDEDTYQLFAKLFEASKKADWLLLNTVYELEGGLVECLRAEKLHVLTVGPLIPGASADDDDDDDDDEDDDDGCLKWLDAQEPMSVVYVAFGSLAVLSETEVKALGEGLQRSQKPFLWALRSPFVEHLPHAFTSETESQGVIVPWAPQFSVLRHPSVGVFISHCGWNSVMESFHAGVPIIGWPIHAEQNTNLKFITEKWKVGIAVEREREGEGESGCVSGESVERAIRRLMEEEEGRDVRKRLGEMSVHMKSANEAGGSSSNNVERFMGEMWARVKGHTVTDTLCESSGS